MTIEEIICAGEIPESFNNIKPGTAVFYAPEDGIDTEVKDLAVDLMDKCMTQREGFALRITVESTSNKLLGGCIVARRLNLGSLLQYNLLIGRVNCQESVDAFVKEFFNLHSRDDEALKFINKKKVRPAYSFDDYNNSFSPTSTLQMLVMRPPAEKEEEEEIVEELTPDKEEFIQQVLEFACKREENEDLALDFLQRLSPNDYTKEECKLVLTEGYLFWFETNSITSELDLTKREKALYLFLLAHPKGIIRKELYKYQTELEDFYFNLFIRLNDDRDDRAIENLVTKDSALQTCITRINIAIDECIRNYTSQLPFRIQTTNGILHIDLPRKYFEWKKNKVIFKYKE